MAIFPFALSDHQSDKLGFSGGASSVKRAAGAIFNGIAIWTIFKLCPFNAKQRGAKKLFALEYI
jgi:hypothetical protein